MQIILALHTKVRIENVMHYKKTALWVVILSVFAMVVLLVGLACNPKNRNESTSFFGQLFNSEYQTTSVSDYVQSVEYFYQYTEFIFDPSVQRYMECGYDAADYENEIARLSQIQTEYEGEVKTALYDEDSFSYPAYITIDESNRCYEYALLLGNRRIAYVFLQFINEEDISFKREYLPLEYEQQKDWRGYSIYLFEQEDGDYRTFYNSEKAQDSGEQRMEMSSEDNDGPVINGYVMVDGQELLVTVTISLADVVKGDEAYQLLQQNGAPAPDADMEYTVATFDITYNDGSVEELYLSKNEASLASARLQFLRSNGESNAEAASEYLNNPIYDIVVSKGETVQGDVAFLGKVDSTEAIIFQGFGESISFAVN